MAVVGLGGHVGGEDALVARHHDLRVVALHPALADLHDATLGIGDVRYRIRIDGWIRRLWLAASPALSGRLLLRPTGLNLRLLAGHSLSRTLLQLRLARRS